MTGGTAFDQAFWDEDFNGTTGWDTLCRRMKDGKKVCSEVAHFFKDRAKAEQDYSKALMNLARKADGKEETGVLGISWREWKTQTEKIAHIHEDAGTKYNTLQDEINKFNEEQKRQKQQIEDNVKKCQQNKKDQYKKTMNLQKSYYQKSKEYETAKENYATLWNSENKPKNQLDKAGKQRDKCTEDRNNADTAYKSAIESLETIRETWEQEYEKSCKSLQDLEENRIFILRDILWKSTNIDSAVCVNRDECCENVRIKLEDCDISKDLQEFIEKNRSGNLRPAKILYQNYHGDHPPQQAQVPKFPPPFRPVPRAGALRLPTIDADDGHYATVDLQTQDVPATSKQLMTVIRKIMQRW